MNCIVCDKNFTGLACFQQHEASEKHKKKLSLLQMRPANSETLTSSTTELGAIYCSTCFISFTDFKNYQKHANSLEHANAVKKNEENIQDECVTTNLLSESNTSQLMTPCNFQSQVLAAPFAKCDCCRKQFSGPEPYQQHIESAGHKKKVGILNLQKSTLSQDSLDGTCNPSSSLKETTAYEVCNVCQMQFTGKEPYQLHLSSTAHRKRAGILSVECHNIFLTFQRCALCDKDFSGPEPYQQHIESAGHKKKAGIWNLQKSTLSQDSLDGTCNPSSSLKETTATTAYEVCNVCQMQFTGKEPYQLHLSSTAHRKRAGILPVECENILLTFQRCALCDKDFSGPVPYQQHMASSVHKKKLLNVPEAIKLENKSLPLLHDSPTHTEVDQPNLSSVSLINNQNWHCQICSKTCTGPAPYQQHIVSEAHCKKLRVAEIEENKKSIKSFLSEGGLENGESSPALKDINVSSSNNVSEINEDSKDFKVHNDLLTCSALKMLDTISVDELNITVFYPDEKIIFDSPIKNKNRLFSDFSWEEIC